MTNRQEVSALWRCESALKTRPMWRAAGQQILPFRGPCGSAFFDAAKSLKLLTNQYIKRGRI